MHINKKERKIKKMKELNGTVSKMNKRIEKLESKIGCQEQYSVFQTKLYIDTWVC